MRKFKKRAMLATMSTFDYEASAELFAPQGRSGIRYQRFPRAAEAIRYAVEKTSDKSARGNLTPGRRRALQCDADPQAHHDRYPLTRANPSCGTPHADISHGWNARCTNADPPTRRATAVEQWRPSQEWRKWWLASASPPRTSAKAWPGQAKARHAGRQLPLRFLHFAGRRS